MCTESRADNAADLLGAISGSSSKDIICNCLLPSREKTLQNKGCSQSPVEAAEEAAHAVRAATMLLSCLAGLEPHKPVGKSA